MCTFPASSAIDVHVRIEWLICWRRETLKWQEEALLKTKNTHSLSRHGLKVLLAVGVSRAAGLLFASKVHMNNTLL